jgi:hypothetical protein
MAGLWHNQLKQFGGDGGPPANSPADFHTDSNKIILMSIHIADKTKPLGQSPSPGRTLAKGTKLSVATPLHLPEHREPKPCHLSPT